jgi:hypothetical protein
MANLRSFELRLRMDATITIKDPTGEATDWLKQGTETAMVWDAIPDEPDLIAKYQIMEQAAADILETVIVKSNERLREGRRRG